MTPADFKSRTRVEPIDIQPYLSRLGVYKELPSLGFLKQIHHYHLRGIPIENLDVFFRRPVVLNVQKLFSKIILDKRGGLCFELNLLFYHLLVHLGYDCHLIAASPWNRDDESYGHMYDHMAILVKVREEILLCDVGLPDGFIYPKKINTEELQMDFDRYFRLTKDRDEVIHLQRSEDGLTFEEIYRFEGRLREPIEFIDRFEFHQTSPESPYVGKRFLFRHSQFGRIKLEDQFLSINERGSNTEERILNDDAFYTKMEEHFGISYQSLLLR